MRACAWIGLVIRLVREYFDIFSSAKTSVSVCEDIDNDNNDKKDFHRKETFEPLWYSGTSAVIVLTLGPVTHRRQELGFTQYKYFGVFYEFDM